jgi:uncharacterized protein (TIGR02996 family)
MSEEAGFLDALDESPDDEATRAAYADWLEERGDARSELFHLERQLLAAPDDWALRERLVGLHATLDAAWVVRVAQVPAPLAELRVAVPPPRRPNHPRGSWAAVEEALGLRLPADYKAFLDVYGVGTLYALDIHHPFTIRGDVREDWIRFAHRYDVLPYPIFPEPGGLLPFGTLGDRGILGWLTEGAPHEWPFVYQDFEQGFSQVKGLSAVELILEAVRGRSPLLIRLGNQPWGPPIHFEPFWGVYGEVGLVHPGGANLEALAERVAARWAIEEVRVSRSEQSVSIRADSLQGTVNLNQGGDPRIWLSIIHGPEGKAQAAALEAEMRAAGFRDLG